VDGRRQTLRLDSHTSLRLEASGCAKRASNPTMSRINFPVFETLDVEGYGLFPERPRKKTGAPVENSQPGLTLSWALTALGKTTS